MTKPRRPEGYVKLDRLAIFHPHSRRGPDGTEYEVTERDLKEIVANARRREDERGMPVLLFFGHRKTGKDVDEQDQPPPMGYWGDLEMGELTRDGKKIPAIYAERWVREDKLEEAKTYPFWSPEYYKGRNEITAVSMLRRDPQLDLGCALYQGGEQPIFYSRDENGFRCDTTMTTNRQPVRRTPALYEYTPGKVMNPTLDPTGGPDAGAPDSATQAQIQQAILAMFPELPALKALLPQLTAMAQSMSAPGMAGPGAPPGPAGAAPPPDMGGSMMNPDMGASPATPPPAPPPGGEGKGPPKKEEEEDEMTQMARQEMQAQYARLEAEFIKTRDQLAKLAPVVEAQNKQIAALQAESATNVKAANEARASERLARIEAEGYMVPEHLKPDILANYMRCTTELERDRVDQQLRCYQRDPTKGDMVVTAKPRDGDPDVITDQERLAANLYMRSSGEEDFEKAVEEVRKRGLQPNGRLR